jgi:formylglycine-generating enzyme required for sulfatase activity
MASSRPPVAIPAHLRALQDRFEFLKPLGAGGMGQVWLVRLPLLNVERAVKVINPEFAHDRHLIERMVREARAMARLNHPHAVTIHSASLEPAYLEMDFVRGKTLDALLKERGRGVPMPLEWTAQFVDQLCSVLQVAHENQIIHRDLKPSNLMLAGGGDPDAAGSQLDLKVLDFGIAKFLDAAPDAFKTVGGRMPYSPLHLSPEQAEEKGELDARSDIYLVGLILYELLTGRHPFFTPGCSPLYVRVAIATKPTPRFKERNPEVHVPEAIERLVLRCLEKDPARRPRSAAELAQEFRRLVPAPVPAAKKTRLRERGWITLFSFLLPALIVGIALGVSMVRGRPAAPLPRNWTRMPGAALVTINMKDYPRAIERRIGGVPDPVVALLIDRRAARADVEQPEPFYIMENKVWVGLFAAFAREHPDAVPDQRWRDPGSLRLPVRSVTVWQAKAFAEWLGGPGQGLLPTTSQWDQAAGRFLKNPRAGPGLPPEPNKPTPRFAVGLARPIPVGVASGDISPYGCRDMSGNGFEWTRPERDKLPYVDLRGQKPSAHTAFMFDDIDHHPDSLTEDQSADDVGFRILIKIDSVP